MSYFVSTFNYYVIVEANTETEARIKATPMLVELAGRNVSIAHIRPATSEEVKLDRIHREYIENERKAST